MIYFLVPTYNEEKNIEALRTDLLNCLPNEEKFYVFSDDGSTDDTISLIDNFFDAKTTKVISGFENAGPGAAFNRGLEYILEVSKNDSDIVVTIEADGTSDINLVFNMVANINLGYDLVLASVYAQGGGFDKTSFVKRLVSSIANLLFRFLFDLRVQTLSSFYRAYSIQSLQRVKLKYPNIIKETGFICMLELLLKLINTKSSLVELPMKLYSLKRVGKSKMKIIKTTWHYLKFLGRVKLKGL